MNVIWVPVPKNKVEANALCCEDRNRDEEVQADHHLDYFKDIKKTKAHEYEPEKLAVVQSGVKSLYDEGQRSDEENNQTKIIIFSKKHYVYRDVIITVSECFYGMHHPRSQG